MEILIAEDEKSIAQSIKKNLADENHRAVIAKDGEEALGLISQVPFDVLLLDWRLPKLTGIEVCKKLRNEGNKIPIILLTALSQVSNKVEALSAGADDYITKPFAFEEVLARIHAVTRRYNQITDNITLDDFSLHFYSRILETKEQQIKLPEKEFELLKFFIQNKEIILTKETICESVWDHPYNNNTNVVEATIKNLRKKLEEMTKKKFIKSVYGEGYIFLEK